MPVLRDPVASDTLLPPHPALMRLRLHGSSYHALVKQLGLLGCVLAVCAWPMWWNSVWWSCMAAWIFVQPAAQAAILCRLGLCTAFVCAAISLVTGHAATWALSPLAAFALAFQWCGQTCECQKQVDDFMVQQERAHAQWVDTLKREWTDCAQMVHAALDQLLPPTFYAQRHEILSACCLPVPITNLAAIHTVMHHLKMLADRIPLFQSSENPPSSTIRREFDPSTLIQNVGDGIAALATSNAVNLILYHTDNALTTYQVIGDDDAIKQALFSLIRNIMDECTPGACIEVGLDQQQMEEKCIVSFQVLHTPSTSLAPAALRAPPPTSAPSTLDSAEKEPLALTFVTKALIAYGHGQLVPVQRGYHVTYALAMGTDQRQRRLTMERSLLDLRHHIQYATEPTLSELNEFLQKLHGIRMLIHAPERSLFAKHLTSCLASWNADICHVPILRYPLHIMSPGTVSSSSSSTPTASSSAAAAVAAAAAAATSSTTINSTSSTSNTSTAVATPAGTPNAPPISTQNPQKEDPDQQQTTPPAFILIDDDLPTLERLLQEYKRGPAKKKQPRAIVYFSTLRDVRRLREMVMQVCAAVHPPPRVIVVPNPCGPRRFLTALHLAWHDPVVDPQFVPIATCPTQLPIYSTTSTPSISNPAAADYLMRVSTPSPSSSRQGSEDMGYFAPRPGHPSASRSTETSPAAPSSVQGVSPSQRTLQRRLRSHSHSIHRHGELTAASTPLLPMTTAHASRTPPAPGVHALPPYPSVSTSLHHKFSNDELRLPSPLDRKGTPTSGPTSGTTPSPAATSAGATPSKTSAAQTPAVDHPSSATSTGAVTSPSAATQEQRSGPKYKISHRKKKDKSKPTPWWSPPIHVLIVEDNMINQAILSTWMKKHKIQYEVASDGKQAVEKWQNGSFHLILMDIQLPVMSGIDATKTIRAKEKDKNIGVLTELSEQFKAPVIIVALTASSLESDRQAALAAGCNDFLTKPVSLEWLEKKIMEWGCMQALIDVEGWRQWKRTADPLPAVSEATRSLADLKTKNASSPSISSIKASNSPLMRTNGSMDSNNAMESSATTLGSISDTPHHRDDPIPRPTTAAPDVASSGSSYEKPSMPTNQPQLFAAAIKQPSTTIHLNIPPPPPLGPSSSTSSASSTTSGQPPPPNGILLKGASTLASKRIAAKPKMLVRKVDPSAS
ncbi:hypothetical protein BC940DRAFT_309073 [Gongronella butleri]|nr:hypothetical protein BC940DRAFT_309073 [Gongronella butleri]